MSSGVQLPSRISTLLVAGALGALVVLAGLPAQEGAASDPSLIGPPIPPSVRARLQRGARTPARTVARGSTSAAGLARTSAPEDSAEVVSSGKFAPVLPPKDYKPPVIVIEDKKFDFGTVYQGEEVTHRFKVENHGGSDLVLNQIKPSCGCTYVNHDRLIKPGESGFVELKVNTQRLRAGTQNKTADIFSNDPTTPKEKVYISGTIETVYTVDPQYPRLEAVRGTANPSTLITLKKTSTESFRITGVSRAPTTTSRAAAATTPERLITELDESEAPDIYKLNVIAKTEEGEQTRNFYEKLDLHIEGEDGRKLTQELSVTVRFKDRISYTPRTVWFRRNEVQSMKAALTGAAPAAPAPAPAARVVKSITLKSEIPDFKFNVTKVETSDDHFGAALEAVAEGSEYKVNVTVEKIPEDQTVRSIKGDVTIHTDDPANPVIRVRVIAYL